MPYEQTKEQRDRAFQDAGVPNTAISSANLSPAPSIQYTTPQQPPIYPVAKMEVPTISMTAPEEKANDLTTQLRGLNDRLVGESDYRVEQERQQGVANTRATITDLSTRLNSLKNEAAAIPLQLQQDATGRGVTAGGLRPIEQGALRTNAIQALTTNSLLQAAQGNLTTALDMVDRAVKERFEPIREEIKAKTDNLNLIISSPEYDVATKNRAQQQLLRQKEAEAQLTRQQDDYETIQGAALQAAQNGAPAAIVNAIMNAKDLATAFSQGQGYLAKETAASIQEYNFAVRGGYKGSFSQYQNEDANRKIAIARAGVANGEFGLSTSQANIFNGIVAKYNASPLIAAADRTTVLKNSIAQARANPSDASTQLNLVYSYIQALDTYQSAVREGELGLINSIDSKTGQLQNAVTKVQNGQLVRPEVAKDIANAAENIVNTINQAAKAKAQSYKSQADTLGLGAAWDKYQSGFQATYDQGKGSMSDRDFVSKAVQSSGQSYDAIISNAPQGQIAVVDNGSGQVGYIPVDEFTSGTYTRL
jgi:hypothetical protein